MTTDNRETIKLEIEVDKTKDYYPVLCYLNNLRYVRGAYYANGVLEVNVLETYTKETIFEMGFYAGLALKNN